MDQQVPWATGLCFAWYQFQQKSRSTCTSVAQNLYLQLFKEWRNWFCASVSFTSWSLGLSLVTVGVSLNGHREKERDLHRLTFEALHPNRNSGQQCIIPLNQTPVVEETCSAKNFDAVQVTGSVMYKVKLCWPVCHSHFLSLTLWTSDNVRLHVQEVSELFLIYCCLLSCSSRADYLPFIEQLSLQFPRPASRNTRIVQAFEVCLHLPSLCGSTA